MSDGLPPTAAAIRAAERRLQHCRLQDRIALRLLQENTNDRTITDYRTARHATDDAEHALNLLLDAWEAQ